MTDMNSHTQPHKILSAALGAIVLFTTLSCAHAQTVSVQDRAHCMREAQTADQELISDVPKLLREAARAGMSAEEYRKSAMMLRALNCIQQLKKRNGG